MSLRRRSKCRHRDTERSDARAVYPVSPGEIARDRAQGASWGSLASTYGPARTSFNRPGLQREGRNAQPGRGSEGNDPEPLDPETRRLLEISGARCQATREDVSPWVVCPGERHA